MSNILPLVLSVALTTLPAQAGTVETFSLPEHDIAGQPLTPLTCHSILRRTPPNTMSLLCPDVTEKRYQTPNHRWNCIDVRTDKPHNPNDPAMHEWIQTMMNCRAKINQP